MNNQERKQLIQTNPKLKHDWKIAFIAQIIPVAIIVVLILWLSYQLISASSVQRSDVIFPFLLAVVAILGLLDVLALVKIVQGRHSAVALGIWSAVINGLALVAGVPALVGLGGGGTSAEPFSSVFRDVVIMLFLLAYFIPKFIMLFFAVRLNNKVVAMARQQPPVA